jgi:hypothetical protein
MKGTLMIVTIEANEERLIEALGELGPGWHTRNDLAAQMDKRRLDPVLATLLEVLVRAGRIERKERRVPGRNLVEGQYRLKEDK